MDPMTQLEARVRTLETSLSRSRLLAFMLGLLVVLIVGAAQVPEAQEAQEVVTTERLVLTNGPDSTSVVLVAGQESSLVIETPAGVEVMRIGGSAVREIRR
jgi:hypothetical protein